jgi:aminoglycoside phosphotransferase (APT) family kinase protein
VSLPAAELDLATATWLAAVLGGEVVEAVSLTGGVGSRVTRIRSSHGADAVLRRFDRQPYIRLAREFLDREVVALELLRGTGVPAPELLAVDLDGSASGEPSLLMSLLPGSVDVRRCDAAYLSELATQLVCIHDVTPSDDWPEEYFSWASESKLHVPPWSIDDGLYRDAFAIVRAGPPSYDRRFLHRDFQPGNVLWQGDSLSGIVDWNFAATGPADLDVAHAASNLANWHGVEAALAWRLAYAEAGGVTTDDRDAAAYWQMIDLVGFLPEGGTGGRESGADPAEMPSSWAGLGRKDLTVGLVRSRREDLLRATLRGA